MKWWKSSKITLVFLSVLFNTLPALLSAQIVNIERQRLNADTNGLSGDADLSFKVVKVVEPLYSFAHNGQIVYRKDRHQLFLIENLLFIKSPGSSFANSGFIHLRYQNPAERPILFESFAQVQFNKLLRVQYRQLLAAGGRVELFPKNEKNKVFFGTSVMHEYEIVQNREEVNSDLRMNYYLALRMKFFERMEFNSTTYYQPKMGFYRDYRLSTENSLLFDISSRIQFKFEFSLFYDEIPPPEVTKSTYSVLNGIRYKFTH